MQICLQECHTRKHIDRQIYVPFSAEELLFFFSQLDLIEVLFYYSGKGKVDKHMRNHRRENGEKPTHAKPQFQAYHALSFFNSHT